MSNSRCSVNDYPEHLNPFYEGYQKTKFWKFGKVKRSSSFGETLRNTLLFKSIRGKKKKEQQNTASDPLELRRNEQRVDVQYRQTLPTIISPSPSPSRVSIPVPLPRSRFCERVAKSYVSTQQELGSDAIVPHSSNPFEKDIPKDDSRRLRRRKRRAPLPPNSVTSRGTLSISSDHNSSKWSLTSDATDLSTYSDSDNLPTYVTDPSVSNNIRDIVKEIEKFADEDDHQEKETDSKMIDIPDVALTKDSIQSTDENCNTVPEICDKNTADDIYPDVLCNVKLCSELNGKPSGHENNAIDSLTTLITSIELNYDDNKLEEKTNSLTNIINSINMIENECYEPPALYVTNELKNSATSVNNFDVEENLNSGTGNVICNQLIEAEKYISKENLVSNVTIE